MKAAVPGWRTASSTAARYRGPRLSGAPGSQEQKEKAPGSGLFSTPSCPGSIVGAEAFHFRVRDGNGWFHLALATRSQFAYSVRHAVGAIPCDRPAGCRCPSSPGRTRWCAPTGRGYCHGSGGGTRTHDLRVMSPASCRCSTPRRVPADLAGVLNRECNRFGIGCEGNGMVVKPSVISTAQLNPLRDLHMPPIKRVVFPRPYPRPKSGWETSS